MDKSTIEGGEKRSRSTKKLKTDTAVEFSHVVIDALALREGLEADPTRVCATPRARHVVASRCALDWRGATRAFLHVVTPHPLLEQTVPSVFTVRAGDAFVVLDVARRADACETRWTGQWGVARTIGVSLRAVWRRAIMVLSRTRLHVSMKRCQRESIEVGRWEYPLRHLHGDQFLALALIAKAANWEGPRVGRSG